jgi:hypothetical protein
MQNGDLIEVVSYRGHTPTIKYGRVDGIRDIEKEPLKDETFKRYVISRSQILVTLKDNDTYRAYYTKYLNYRPISLFKRIWLKLKGTI